MKPEGKKRNIAFTASLAVCLLLFLLCGGTYFVKYLQKLIFEERTTQLNEITDQVQINLNNALDAHWNYLTAAVNLLEMQEFDTLEEVTTYIEELEGIIEADSYSSELMLLDSQGNCYDNTDRKSVV